MSQRPRLPYDPSDSESEPSETSDGEQQPEHPGHSEHPEQPQPIAEWLHAVEPMATAGDGILAAAPRTSVWCQMAT